MGFRLFELIRYFDCLVKLEIVCGQIDVIVQCLLGLAPQYLVLIIHLKVQVGKEYISVIVVRGLFK